MIWEMSLAKLQLDRYRLSSLKVKFNEAWLTREREPHEEQYDVQPDFDVFNAADQRPMLRLTVTCSGAVQEGPAACRFIEIEATVWGVFSLAHDVNEEERWSLILFNGLAMLHGIARGVLISATGGCVGGPFILPAVNYADLIRTKMSQLELEEAEENTGEIGGR